MKDWKIENMKNEKWKTEKSSIENCSKMKTWKIEKCLKWPFPKMKDSKNEKMKKINNEIIHSWIQTPRQGQGEQNKLSWLVLSRESPTIGKGCRLGRVRGFTAGRILVLCRLVQLGSRPYVEHPNISWLESKLANNTFYNLDSYRQLLPAIFENTFYTWMAPKVPSRGWGASGSSAKAQLGLGLQ